MKLGQFIDGVSEKLGRPLNLAEEQCLIEAASMLPHCNVLEWIRDAATLTTFALNTNYEATMMAVAETLVQHVINDIQAKYCEPRFPRPSLN